MAEQQRADYKHMHYRGPAVAKQMLAPHFKYATYQHDTHKLVVWYSDIASTATYHNVSAATFNKIRAMLRLTYSWYNEARSGPYTVFNFVMVYELPTAEELENA